MANIIKHLLFHKYLNFDQGGINIMGVKGLMFPLPFLAMLYQISCELGSKEKINEILYRAGERQTQNAIEYTKNKLGLNPSNIVRNCNFVLSQAEIGGMGILKLRKINAKDKKLLIEQNTEYFEDVLNKIFSPQQKVEITAIIQYCRGGIAALASFVYGIPMETTVALNRKEKKYYYTAQPRQETKSSFSLQELEKLDNIINSYSWKHLRI